MDKMKRETPHGWNKQSLFVAHAIELKDEK